MKKKIYAIELLMAISVLATVVLVAVKGMREKAYRARSLQEMHSFEVAMALYVEKYGGYSQMFIEIFHLE